MKLNGIGRKVSGAALTLALMFGITLMASATAQAQYRDYDGYGRQGHWDRNRTREYAFLLGYHNSYSQGKDAGERGYRVNHSNIQEYREGTNGFLTWMGDRNTYRDNYRRGFAQGFRDGQEGRSRRYTKQDVERVLGARLRDVYNSDRFEDDWYDRNRGRGRDRDRDGIDDRYERDNGYGRNDRDQVYRIAQQNGYQDGQREGLDDRNRRRGYSVDNSSEYRNAMRGYRSEYGDRSAFQQGYRDGFRRGYDDAYRRGTSSGRGFPWPF
jgi:flagellar biosynthesis/type III secretory pathway protein FliH